MLGPKRFQLVFAAGMAGGCLLHADTVLKVELGGSTGKVVTSSTEAVGTSTNTAHGSHAGTAGFGRVGAGSRVTIASTGNDPGLNAVSTFIDNFTVTSPSYASFVRGTFIATVSFNGGLTLAPSGLSPGDGARGGTTYRLNVFHSENINPNSSGFPVINQTGRLDFDRLFSEEVTTTGIVPPATQFQVEIPFKFGIPTQIKMELLVASFAAITDLEPAGATLDANAHFAMGARWEGIADVRHISGTPVTEYLIDTESGINWLEPQPVEYVTAIHAALSPPNGASERFLEMVVTRRKPDGSFQYQIDASSMLSGWMQLEPGTGNPLAQILSTNSIDQFTEQIVVRRTTPYSPTGNSYLRIQALPME